MSRASAKADAYSPTPKIACVARLRSRATFGFGVFDAAKPKPMPGCMTKNGAATVTTPNASAGPGDGWRAHSTPVSYTHLTLPTIYSV